MRTIITRSGQITLGKEIRQELGLEVGMPIEVNKIGRLVIVEKASEEVFEEVGDFLPKNFKEVLKKIRTDEVSRLKKLKITN